jgi:general secretion pathway protein A
MYAPYFGLSQEPFSIAPDPRYLYMSERHREALAHLLYGLGGGGGFVLLTGGIGTGKTTVCRCFLEQIPEQCNVAYIFNPKLTALELLQSICDEFRIQVPAAAGARTIKEYLDPLNAFLLQQHAQGRNSVLIIDEAQNLSAEVLEQLRLLTNLETSERKLLQIVLIGQPELRELLARPDLEQLAQRVVARFHLDALSVRDTALYVRHRLEVAGLSRALPFEPRALVRVHRLTGGVPRRINLLCDRALLGAFARSEPAVSVAIVEQAAREVFGPAGRRRERKGWSPALVLGLGVAAGAAAVAVVQWWMLPSLATQRVADASQPDAARAASGAASAPSPASAGDPPAGTAAPAIVPAGAVVAAAAQPGAAATLHRDERQAWRELAGVWGAQAGEGDPCAALARESLHCFTPRAVPLSLIRQLDRPGIVTLDRDSGKPSYAVLTALGDKSATLTAGGTSQTVTLAALAARWSGEWATLWRAPPGVDPRSPDRTDKEAVRWVESHLPDAPAGQPLAARVRSFQLAQGLPADGRLGPLTFMQLNRNAGVAEPRLQSAP